MFFQLLFSHSSAAAAFGYGEDQKHAVLMGLPRDSQWHKTDISVSLSISFPIIYFIFIFFLIASEF